jgi:hypothetical protein
MAVNTRERRFSMMAMGMPFLLRLPVANGSNMNSEGQRQMMLGMYSGMDVAAPSTPQVVFTGGPIPNQVFQFQVPITPVDFSSYFNAGGLPVTHVIAGSNGLPNGLSFSAAGVLSGTPLASDGFYGFRITATDSNQAVAQSNFFDMQINHNIIGGGLRNRPFGFGLGF